MKRKATSKSNNSDLTNLESLIKKNKCKAVLSIEHDSMPPQEIEKLFQLSAHSAHKLNDTLFKNERFEIKSNRNVWSYSTESKVSEPDPAQHVLWLLAQVEDKPSILKDLKARGATINILVYLYPWTRFSMLEFESDVLVKLQQLTTRLTVLFDYQNSDSEY